VESGTDGQPNGLRVLAAISRERHGRRVGDLESELELASYHCTKVSRRNSSHEAQPWAVNSYVEKCAANDPV
jgi:hypothetical protein